MGLHSQLEKKFTRASFSGALRVLPQRKPGCVEAGRLETASDRTARTEEAAIMHQKAAENEIVNSLAMLREVVHSPGQPLDAETRAFFEPCFGHDLSQVRVHADAKAAEASA